MNYYQVRGSARSKKTQNPANPEGWRINRNIGVVADSVEGALNGATRVVAADEDLSDWSVDQVNKMGEVNTVASTHTLGGGPAPNEVHFGSPYYVLERENSELRIRNRDLLDLSKRLQNKLDSIRGATKMYCTCNPPKVGVASEECDLCGLPLRSTRNGIPFCEKCGGYHNNHCPDLMRRG